MRGTLIRLGTFVAVCGAITVYLVFTIGNVQSFKIGPFQLLRDQYELAATFDDVTGLLKNDNVKVAGVVVGKVTRVAVEKGHARVHFTVNDDVKLPSDSSAAIRWRNLLGQRYLYVFPGTASTALEDGDSVKHTQSVVDLGELFNRLGPIVQAIDPAKVNQFLDSVVGALDGNEDKIRAALDDLAVLASALGERDQAIGRLVENLDTVAGTIVDRDREIRSVLDNLVTISRTFNENTDVLDRAITELGDFSRDFGTLLQNNRAHIDSLISNLTKIVAVVQTRLPGIDTAVTNLDEAATRLFNASKYGEWLNQTIPCGRFGYPLAASVGPPCTAPPNGPASAPGPARATAGVEAVFELLGGDRAAVGGRR